MGINWQGKEAIDVSKVILQLEQKVVDLLQTVPGRLEDILAEYLILEVYRRGQVSSGKAGELLGMERLEFVRYASRLGIPFLDMDEREWEAELASVRGLE